MRPTAPTNHSIRRRRVAAGLVTALLLAACGGDDPSDAAPDSAEESLDETDELEDGAGDLADDAEEQLDDAGVDTGAGGYAEVQFQGEMLRVEAAEGMLSCFITEDGGSEGAISFEGTDEAGNVVTVDWAGDTPEISGMVNVDLADGSEWTTPMTGAGMDVTITGGSAVVSATLVAVAGTGEEADVVVRPACG